MTRRIGGLLLAGTWLLAACTMGAPSQARRPVTPRATVKPSASPVTTAASSKASPSAKPAASPSPLGPTVTLKGKVALDAHYLIAAKAGTLVSNNGGSAVVLKGGSIISDNGLGLISDNGLGLISNNGLSIIANNGSSYRVTATDGVAVGTILPVKGMVVIPVSMRTNEVVGKPALTDEKGEYTLDVPERLQGNLRLVAKVPVASQSDPIAKDPRLQYNLVTPAAPAPAAAAPVTLDEDTALVTRYLRTCFASRIKESITTQDLDKTTADLLRALNAPDALLATLKGVIADLNKAGKDIQVSTLPPEKVDLIAQRATDVLLSYMDLAALEVDPVALKREGKGTKELAVPAIVDILKQLRSGATTKMAADPTYFATQPYIVGAKTPTVVTRPSDVCQFLVDEILSAPISPFDQVILVITSVGMPEAEAHRLNTLSMGMLAAVGQTLFINTEARAQMIKAILESAE